MTARFVSTFPISLSVAALVLPPIAVLAPLALVLHGWLLALACILALATTAYVATYLFGWVELERIGRRWFVREGFATICTRRLVFARATLLDVQVAPRAVHLILRTVGSQTRRVEIGARLAADDVALAQVAACFEVVS